MATTKYTAKLDRLRALEGAAQVDYALRLAQSEKHAEVIEAALDVWLVADVSGSVDWGTALCLKRYRAIELAG